MSQSLKSMTASDIARETIKQMAIRRVEPTPDHYMEIYHEISGLPAQDSGASTIRKTLKQLPHDTSTKLNWINRWDKKLKDQPQQGLVELLSDAMEQSATHSELWPKTIRILLQGWDERRSGLDSQKKRALMERVLINFGQDPLLPEKLVSMANQWLSTASNTVELRDDVDMASTIETSTTEATMTTLIANQAIDPLQLSSMQGDAEAGLSQHIAQPHVQQALSVLQTILKQTLHLGLIPRLHGYPTLQKEANTLLAGAERSKKLKEWEALAKDLKALLLKVEMIGANEDDVRADVIDLLHLLLSNVGELVTEDAWLSGQVYAVQTMISGPLDRQKLKAAEKSLKEVIYKQGLLKHSLNEAKHSFKSMVGTFIDRLKYMGEASDQYGNNIETYAQQLAETDDLMKINQLVEQLMRETSSMQADIVRSRDALLAEQAQAQLTQQRIDSLQEELMQVSELVRVDQLTGVLNRRGMDEAFAAEIARFHRQGEPLSVALLDIDNFKLLNDHHGHVVGDDALKHLTAVVRRTVRPTDIVTRLGGEEFVILLPNTPLQAAVSLMTRLQRELTKAYFLGNNEKLLITFSAGVALFKEADDMTTILQRADRAMYHAKKLGKNRVVTETDLPL